MHKYDNGYHNAIGTNNATYSSVQRNLFVGWSANHDHHMFIALFAPTATTSGTSEMFGVVVQSGNRDNVVVMMIIVLGVSVQIKGLSQRRQQVIWR